MDLNVEGKFYATYKHLRTDFDQATFTCAENTVRKLLSTATNSEHPGMLLGKVQSGKTRAFITTLALAFDNSYDIAIILSKNSKALIEQTTKRLSGEFSFFVNEVELDIYDIMHAPDQYTQFELESKLIFVAKKQKDNLDRLISLMSKTCPAMATKRVLIIDDEADNASIGYKKNADEIDATIIAAKISELRAQSDSVSFLQVTATPYSLYLQPQSVEVGNVFSFKPVKPAFTELVPIPSTYVGGDTYFGEKSIAEDITVERLIHYPVDPAEFNRLKKPDRRSVRLEELLSSNALVGYRTAIITFIVGGCIQRINGISAGKSSSKLRYSLLLHSEAGKSAHSWQQQLTEKIKDQLTDAAEQNSSIFKSLVKTSYDNLCESLLLNDDPIPLWDVLIEEVKLSLTKGYISITKVNSDNDVAALLDSNGQLRLKSPLSIFIGGQVLDRGVTLANLIGFYYGRRPTRYQQDTVLQHSRMYGYRKADLGVTRFYTSAAIRDAMFRMEEFDNSLRSAIESGSNQAVQFIRQAENGSIVPCSPNKILLSEIQVLRPYKRILPSGFETNDRAGKSYIANIIEVLDFKLEELCEIDSEKFGIASLKDTLDLLSLIKTTLIQPAATPTFDWDAAKAALIYLSQLHPEAHMKNKVLLWVFKNRDASRETLKGHTFFNDRPDTTKKEGRLAKEYARQTPALFLLKQNGSRDKGWSGSPFYWPVIYPPAITPVSIYSSETI